MDVKAGIILVGLELIEPIIPTTYCVYIDDDENRYIDDEGNYYRDDG